MDERQTRDILASLEGIHRMQKSVRGTELDPEALTEAAGAVGEKGTPEQRRALADRLASDAAFAQTIRAANVYREKLGYEPLGPNGELYPGEEADA